MPRLIATASVWGLVSLCLAGSNWLAAKPPQAAAQQTPAAPRLQSPPLFFREDWTLASGLPNSNTPVEPEHTLVQRDEANPNLEVHVYGDKTGPVAVKQLNNNDITYVMTLLCTSNCASALRDKNNDVDLTGLATIRWRTTIGGFHELHPIVKLADGRWLVGDKGDGTVADWRVSEINYSELRWLVLDIDKVVTRGRWLDKVDLTKVDEVGFTDLMPGSGHGDGGYSDLGLFEVYGKPVPRSGGQSQQ